MNTFITYNVLTKNRLKRFEISLNISDLKQFVCLGDKSIVDLVSISKQAKECNKQNEQDSEGNTAVHLAVFVYRNLSEHAIAQTVVELLLMNGVNPLLDFSEI